MEVNRVTIVFMLSLLKKVVVVYVFENKLESE